MARPLSEPSFRHRVEMPQVDDRRPRQPRFSWCNANSHRELGDAGIAGDSRHNSQLAATVAHIVLNDEAWVAAGHLACTCRRKIDKVNLTPLRKLHLSPPSLVGRG